MYQANTETVLDGCGMLEEYKGREEQTETKNRCQREETQMMPSYPLRCSMKLYKNGALTLS